MATTPLRSFPLAPAFQIEAGDVVTLATGDDPTILAEFVVLDIQDDGDSLTFLIVPAASLTDPNVDAVFHLVDWDEEIPTR